MDSNGEFTPLQITEPPTSTVVVSTRKWKMVYGFISLFGCIESFLTTFAVGYGGFASLGQLIGNLIAFWAFVTWIWTIVLLSFIMRPPRPEPQFWRRRKPHLVWFIGSGAVWGGLTAAFISQLPRQCKESKVSGCILGSISSAIGAAIFGLSVLLVYLIHTCDEFGLQIEGGESNGGVKRNGDTSGTRQPEEAGLLGSERA